MTCELHYLLAGARLRQSDVLQDPPSRQTRLLDAQQQNRWACELHPAGSLPSALIDQRTEILARLGNAAAAGLRTPTNERDRRSPEVKTGDLYLALQSLRHGRYADAAPRLEAACQAAPFDVSLWLLWGNALVGCGRLSEAEGCYNTCVNQWPESYLGWWYRGLCRMEQRKFREAQLDFEQVLQRRPDFLPALINRGLAHREQGQLVEAEGDLSDALARGATQTRLYFLRSQLRRRLGDAAGAAADGQQGLQLAPLDELSWIERGLARMKSDPVQALADFRQAVQLNPASRAVGGTSLTCKPNDSTSPRRPSMCSTA